MGHSQDALGALEAALGFMKLRPHSVFEHEIRRLKGELPLEQAPDAAGEEAESCFRDALDLPRGQKARSLELRAATSLARPWRSQGKRAEARDLLQTVYDGFTEGFDTQGLKDARAPLGELA